MLRKQAKASGQSKEVVYFKKDINMEEEVQKRDCNAQEAISGIVKGIKK